MRGEISGRGGRGAVDAGNLGHAHEAAGAGPAPPARAEEDGSDSAPLFPCPILNLSIPLHVQNNGVHIWGGFGVAK